MLLHTAERSHKCKLCSKCFTQKHHLKVHQKIHDREKLFGCKACDKKFASKYQLAVHSGLHDGRRPHLCTKCGESFKTEIQLTEHNRFHGGTKSFVCQNCGQSFDRKFELMDHLKQNEVCKGEQSTQENSTKDLIAPTDTADKYHCSICGIDFEIEEKLIFHEFMEHSEIGIEDKLEDYEPSLLQDYENLDPNPVRDFPDMNMNAQEDTSKPQFACPACQIGFFYQETLAFHLLLHTGDRRLLDDVYSLLGNIPLEMAQQEQQNLMVNNEYRKYIQTQWTFDTILKFKFFQIQLTQDHKIHKVPIICKMHIYNQHQLRKFHPTRWVCKG